MNFVTLEKDGDERCLCVTVPRVGLRLQGEARFHRRVLHNVQGIAENLQWK